MRERELKLANSDAEARRLMSLPMRERELKPDRVREYLRDRGRSPCGSVN